MIALKHKRVTRDMLRSWDACYTDPEIDECFSGMDHLRGLEVLDLDIPAADRIWVLSHMMTDRAAREFACDCAERVVGVFESGVPGDTRPRDCIAVARRYATGEASEDEMAAAEAAAQSAARSAAQSAARSAAWSAARSAAESAAEAAAWSAAQSAARSAAGSAAWYAAWSAAKFAAKFAAESAAEQQWQIDRVGSRLRRSAGG